MRLPWMALAIAVLFGLASACGPDDVEGPYDDDGGPETGGSGDDETGPLGGYDLSWGDGERDQLADLEADDGDSAEFRYPDGFRVADGTIRCPDKPDDSCEDVEDPCDDNDEPCDDVPPPEVCPWEDAEGCSPGYWKRTERESVWEGAGIEPDDLVIATLCDCVCECHDGEDAAPSKPWYPKKCAGCEPPSECSCCNYEHDATFSDALRGGGGAGLDGAMLILNRALAAALLNYWHEDVCYSRKCERVLKWAKKLLCYKPHLITRSRLLQLAEKLDKCNNRGCPIDVHWEPGDDNGEHENDEPECPPEECPEYDDPC